MGSEEAMEVREKGGKREIRGLNNRERGEKRVFWRGKNFENWI